MNSEMNEVMRCHCLPLEKLSILHSRVKAIIFRGPPVRRLLSSLCTVQFFFILRPRDTYILALRFHVFELVLARFNNGDMSKSDKRQRPSRLFFTRTTSYHMVGLSRSID
jgi:hypothetical protein